MKTRIKKLRKDRGLTQIKLAKEIDVTRQTIGYLEKGVYVPSLTTAMKIADVFKCSIEDIFELDKEDYEKKKGTH